jgi:uncharacterized RDD family membrane protein YckC
LFVDSVLIGLIVWLVTALFATNGATDGQGIWTDGTWLGSSVFLVYCPLFALPTRGRTSGKMLVRIRLATVEGTHPLWLFVLLRYLLRSAPIVDYRVFDLLSRTRNTSNFSERGAG